MIENTEISKSNTKLKFLNRHNEKILKGLHLFFVSLTLGSIFSILILFILKNTDSANNFMIDWSMFHMFEHIVYYSFLGNFLTGLTYSLFTHWGFFKVYWVTLKWIGFLLFFLLLVFVLEPALLGLVSLSDSGLYLTDEKEYLLLDSKLILSLIVIIIILITLLFISTIKPWKSRKKDLVSTIKLARVILISLVVFSSVLGIYSTSKLSTLRNMPIAKVNLMDNQDGIYEGVFNGGGGPYTVQVTIKNHKFIDIQLTTARRSKYIRYARGVLPKIINNQSLKLMRLQELLLLASAL